MYKKFLKIGWLSFDKKGFTLTEMMTVAIILSILVAVMVGTFRSSLERAKFQEGVNVANTVASSLERYFAEHQDLAWAQRAQPALNALDMSFDKMENCTSNTQYCMKTKNFEVQIERQDNFVNIVAYRPTVANPKYRISVIPDFVRHHITPITNEILAGGSCRGDADLCKAMGYTQSCENFNNACAGNTSDCCAY